MKRNITKLLLPLTLFSAIGCSDNIQSGDKDVETIQLYVAGSGLSAATKADIVPFGTTIFASTQSGVYTSLSATDEWMKDAVVAKNGSVSFKDNSKPSYPETGGWIYLIAVAPAVQTSAGNTGNGTVTYTLGDTPQDLLYAKEIRGSRWDGQRFSGNPVSADDKPLAYEHLLTQLKFKARKATAGGLDVTVTKITVQDVQTSVTLTLSDEQAAKLLTGDPMRPDTRRKPGSGVGLKNVQSRIHLYFGEQYGLTIDSEPDEGTRVIIRLPAIPYGTMEES